MATNTSTLFAPSNFILKSYNLLKKDNAKDLTNITNSLIEIRSESFINSIAKKPSSYLNQQTAQQINTATYSKSDSSQSTYEKIAATFGISGSYGYYSGSLQSSFNSEQFNSATYFSSNCVGYVNKGTTSFDQPITSSIISCFNSTFIGQLKGVNSLQTAKNFITTYGTHVALGWNLGGSFSISIHAETSTYEDQLAVKAKANAAYQNVTSVNASASAAYDLSQQGSEYNLSQKKVIIGGNASAAGQVSIKTNDTNIDQWVNTCTTDTTYGIYKSISMADLAEQLGFDAIISNSLRQYVNLAILQHSLENPTTFSNHVALQQKTTVSVTATAGENYKIVSGGATLTKNYDTQSYLTGCYPEVKAQPNNEPYKITGWTAASHDCISKADISCYLTSLAIAVYDPGNYLEHFVSLAPGTNSGQGGDKASSPVFGVPGFILTGGGAKTIVDKGNVKYLTSNGPEQKNGQWVSWDARVHDYYANATEVMLTGFAIGIRSTYLTIVPTLIASAATQKQSHGNQTATLDGGLNIIGGGVTLGETGTNSYANNLLKVSHPSSDNAWTEYNSDLNGLVAESVATAYAIGVSVTINGVS